MNPSLDTLHPLLYPPAPAFGQGYLWLALLAPASLILASGLWLWLRRAVRTPAGSGRHADSPLHDALQQLQQLPSPAENEPAGPWLQQLNQLLKRFCAVRFPDLQGHRLSGREWLAFLDSRCPSAGLSHWMILVEGSYQPHCQLDATSVDGIRRAVETWMQKHV